MAEAPQLQPVPREAGDIDRHVYRSGLVAIGAYRCRPDHAWFDEPGPILNHCIVFPRVASVIEPDGHSPFVGDQNTISIYNAGQRYRRRRLSHAGDACDYFAVAEPTLREIVRAHDPAAADRERLFSRSHLTGHPALYLRQRRLFQRAVLGSARDRLGLDEQVLWLLDAVVRDAVTSRAPARRSAAAGGRHEALVEAAKLVLARRVSGPLPLGELAREVGSSPYHLCRVFRAVTGATVHQHRLRLRVATALARLEAGGDLTAIALDLGFSSHSHFTAAFRGAFGEQPARVRRWLSRQPPRGRRRALRAAAARR